MAEPQLSELSASVLAVKDAALIAGLEAETWWGPAPTDVKQHLRAVTEVVGTVGKSYGSLATADTSIFDCIPDEQERLGAQVYWWNHQNG